MRFIKNAYYFCSKAQTSHAKNRYLELLKWNYDYYFINYIRHIISNRLRVL